MVPLLSWNSEGTSKAHWVPQLPSDHHRLNFERPNFERPNLGGRRLNFESESEPNSDIISWRSWEDLNTVYAKYWLFVKIHVIFDVWSSSVFGHSVFGIFRLIVFQYSVIRCSVIRCSVFRHSVIRCSVIRRSVFRSSVGESLKQSLICQSNISSSATFIVLEPPWMPHFYVLKTSMCRISHRNKGHTSQLSAKFTVGAKVTY